MTTAPFNQAVVNMAAPPVPTIQQAARRYTGDRGNMIDLSQAVPGYPPHPDLMRWLSESAGATENLGYGPIEGEPALREAYAEHLSAIHGAPVVPGEIHIMAGCNQAYVVAALALAGRGDAVLLVSPFYFNHDTSLAMMGVRTATCPTFAANGFLPDLDDLATAITPDVRAVCIVTPNNPTGAIYDGALLGEIFDLCARRGVWMICDETYRDFLPWEGPPT